MTLDPTTNFGEVTVSGKYSDTDTSISLIAGDGAKLPTSGAFNVVWWEETLYPRPLEDTPKREIVRVTNNVDDVLTIARAQEGTTASSKSNPNSTYKMIRSFTKKDYDQISDHLDYNQQYALMGA